MPSLDGLKVVLSKIHGYGIVALRPFKAGDVLVHGDGVMYQEEQDFDDTYSWSTPMTRTKKKTRIATST